MTHISIFGPLHKMVLSHLLGYSCIIYLALLWHLNSIELVHADEAEPSFPRLTGYGKNRIKIVSESVDERLGRQTSEEYHDLDIFKSAYLTTTVVGGSQTAMSISAGNDYQVRYIDAKENLAYSYRPFQCKVAKLTDLPETLFDQDQNWNFGFKTDWRGRKQRYYGVYGLWMYANNAERSFSKAQFVYSAAKDIYRESLLWSVRDEENKLTINMFYIQHDDGTDKKSDHSARQEPTLEMIEIEVDDPESKTKKRRIRSINILSIEYALPEEAYTDLFEPPVGFGCFSSLIAENDASIMESRRRDANKWQDWAQHSLHVDLEVTGTKHNLVQGPSGAVREESISETHNVEVAQSKVQALLEKDFIEMIRVRNSAGDRKVVINHLLRVLYAIDMRTGTCDMSHISPQQEEKEADLGGLQKKTEATRTDELYEIVSLKFKNNGLALDIGVRIFKDPDDLHFIKKTEGSARQPEMHYFEGSGIPFLKNLEDPAANGGIPRKVRMISSYIREADSLELHSITIWVLNEQQTRILESYLLNVLEARPLIHGWPDEAKMFDVSEECYLENERMVQNRDYAWLELTYPAERRALNVFASNEQQLKQEFYEKAVMDFSRVPRLELLLQEDSFTLRLLKLDVPPTELLFDKIQNQALMPATERGDLTYFAPDLAHCGHYCRMHLCTVMSFCSALNSCTLSSRRMVKSDALGPEHIENVFVFSNNNACDTYKMPAIIERNQVIQQNRLQSTIAKYQQQNYGVTSLPKVPDELALPRSETGLSLRGFMTVVKEYEAELEKALESDHRLPELALASIIGERYFVFIPSKFEIESDPLREFNLYDGTEDDEDEENEQNLPRFHQGLPGSRYNLAAQAVASEQSRDELAFRTFSGLTYDQCAMACADSKCGSFSFCTHQGGDCVLSNINSTGRARTLAVVQEDPQCFIAQRDFLRNFDRFPSIFRPQVYTKSSEAGDASECALNCVSETSFKCLSFEFCDRKLASSETQASGQCYYQIERHLPGGEQLPSNIKSKKDLVKPQTDSKSRCDHYSRSYLADFVRLESRKLVDPVVEQLKTSSFSGLSVFSCAEKCATELLDCTGFQFCHLQDAVTSQEARQCTTIESKVTAQVLKAAGQVDDTQTLVDEKLGGRIVQAGKYLQFDEHCQVFTLSRDTAESQLRDLALGGLIKTKAEKEAEERARAGANRSGRGLTFVGGLFLYVVVAAIAAAIGCGVVMLRDRNDYVRQRVERLRILAGI